MIAVTAFLLEAKSRLVRHNARLWGFRNLIIAGLVVLAAELATRIQPVDPAWLVPVLAAAAGVCAGTVGWIRDRPSLTEVARLADRRTGGAERLATAWALSGQEGALVTKQRADAEAWVTTSDSHRVVTGRIPRHVKLGAALAVALAMASVLAPDSARSRKDVEEAAQATRGRVADDLAELAAIAAAEGRPGEDSGRRQAVVRELRMAAAALREADETEAAVAALSRSQQALQDLGDQSASGRQHAASAAGAELARSGVTAAAGAALSASGDSTATELAQLAQALPDLTGLERSAAASRLRDAASVAKDGAAAQRLRSAVEKLEAGDIPATKDALNQAARAQQEQEVAKASQELQALADSVPRLTSEQEAELARALEKAAAAARDDPPLAEALSRSADALRGKDPNEAAAALEAAGRRTEDLPAERNLDEQITKAAGALQAGKAEILRCRPPSFSAGDAGQVAPPPVSTEEGPCGGAQPAERAERASRSAGQSQDQSSGQGDGTGRGLGQGAGSGEGGLGPGGDGQTGAGGRSGAKGKFTGPPGVPGEQLYVPDLAHQGRTRDLTGSTGPGSASALLPYESVYGSYRAAALTQADRQAIPEGRRDLLRRYFDEPTP